MHPSVLLTRPAVDDHALSCSPVLSTRLDDDLMTKRTAALLVLAPAAVLLGVCRATWVAGPTTDPVLGPATVTVTGAQAAPGTVALVLVSVAALLGMLMAGRRLRTVSAVLMVLAALGALVVTARVLLAPAEAVGRRAAEQAGRVGTVTADAAGSAWLSIGFAASGVLVVGTVVAWVQARRWSGLSDRFDRVQGQGGQPGTPPPRSTWDALSSGVDPTDDRPGEPT